MKNQSQTGFALVETLLVVIILALIGGTGYYVWHSKQTADKTLDAATKSSQSSATGAGATTVPKSYLTIEEWGVKFPLSNDMTDGVSQAYYVMSDDNRSLTLSMTDFKGTDCAADDVSLGAIVRFLPTDKDDDGTLLTKMYPQAIKVGEWEYAFVHPQAGCEGGLPARSPMDNTAMEQTNAFTSEFEAAANKIKIAD